MSNSTLTANEITEATWLSHFLMCSKLRCAECKRHLAHCSKHKNKGD